MKQAKLTMFSAERLRALSKHIYAGIERVVRELRVRMIGSKAGLTSLIFLARL